MFFYQMSRLRLAILIFSLAVNLYGNDECSDTSRFIIWSHYLSRFELAHPNLNWLTSDLCKRMELGVR